MEIENFMTSNTDSRRPRLELDEMLARLPQIPPTVREIGHNAPAFLNELRRESSKYLANPPPPMAELFGIKIVEDHTIPDGFVEFRWSDGRRERKRVGG